MQLHSTGPVTSYILDTIFYSSELCNIEVWTREFDFGMTFRAVLGGVYSESQLATSGIGDTVFSCGLGDTVFPSGLRETT